jgi:hypothetical protein
MRFPIAPKRRPHRTGLSRGRLSICLLNQKQSRSANVRFSPTIIFLLRDIKQTQTYHRGSRQHHRRRTQEQCRHSGNRES